MNTLLFWILASRSLATASSRGTLSQLGGSQAPYTLVGRGIGTEVRRESERREGVGRERREGVRREREWRRRREGVRRRLDKGRERVGAIDSSTILEFIRGFRIPLTWLTQQQKRQT